MIRYLLAVAVGLGVAASIDAGQAEGIARQLQQAIAQGGNGITAGRRRPARCVLHPAPTAPG